MTNRLERFRTLTQAFDAAKPARPGEFYVEPAHSLSERVAARLELQPGSTIALLGGVGSGKSTLMLASAQRLTRQAGWYSAYFDIAQKHDLSELKPGTILAAIGLEIAERLQKTPVDSAKHPAANVKHAASRFRGWAHGYATDRHPDDFDPFDDGSEWVRGLLTPPERPFYGDVKQMLDSLLLLVEAAAGGAEHRVFFLDSLDRLVKVADFATAMEEDVRALNQLGAVVVAGPLQLLFGQNRPILDRFTEFLHQAAFDPDSSAHREFLKRILRTRADIDLLSDDVVDKLVVFSGGVPRDLINLARGAAEQAYIAGSERLEYTDANAAIEAFGRKLLLGLTQLEVDRLRSLASSSRFLSISDDDISLLVTRRILEYQNGQTRYAVHPAVGGLLE